MNSEMKGPGVVAPELISTGGSVTKRMESESVVILSMDPNGNFMMKIVIENRGSR